MYKFCYADHMYDEPTGFYSAKTGLFFVFIDFQQLKERSEGREFM